MAARRAFAEDTLIVDTGAPAAAVHPWDEPVEAEVFAALVLGVRDYARKCGFTRALLGLSGGIDSALTAVIAVEALGRDNVTGVLMPSPFSSAGQPDRCRGPRRRARHPDPHRCRSRRVMTAFDDVLAEPFAGVRPMSPRRTCRRASAGRC